jgi:hypothetical protein
MAPVPCTDVPSRPLAFLDGTSLPRDAFQQLVRPFAAACQTPRAAGRLDGKPRTARRCSVDQPCPFPPPEDRGLCRRA